MNPIARNPNEQIGAHLSRKQVAALASTHPKTVARAEARGDLLAVKLNSRLTRYREEDVRAWLRRGRTTVAAAK